MPGVVGTGVQGVLVKPPVGTGVVGAVQGGGGGGGPTDPFFSSVAYLLHFDGSNGGVVFTDVKGNTVTTIGTAALTTTGPLFGTAALSVPANTAGCELSGAGVGGTSYPGDIPPATPVTIEGSVNPTAIGTIGGIWSAGVNGAAQNMLLRCNADGTLTFVHGAIDRFSSTAALTAGVYNQVALTRDASNVFRMFINGALQAATYTSGSGIGQDPTTTQSICRSLGFAMNSAALIGVNDEWRYTKGVCRYTSTYVPAVAAFPNS